MPTPMPPSTPTHYELLQLPVTASEQELRQAFRSLSKRYHPDTTSLPAREAALAFQGLQVAYAVLSDPQSRRAYDSSLLPPATPKASNAQLERLMVARPTSPRRALSGGEWFALLLLAMALVLSLVLGIGVAWARGAELVRPPSWWGDRAMAPPSPPSLPPALLPAPSPSPDFSLSQPHGQASS